MLHWASCFDGTLERHRQRKTDTRFGKWKVRSVYRASSLDSVARELAKYNFDVVAVQYVRWDEDGSQPADGYTFLYGSGGSFVHTYVLTPSCRILF